MPRPFPHPHPQAGFSLLEMSVVLAIIAIITAGTFSMGNSVLESARIANTNNKLDTIETALMAFRLANNRLPCPGDVTLSDIPADSTTYGYEANNASGTCTGGSPAANYSYTLSSPPANTAIPGGTAIAEGAVPVRTLGLPDEFQFDGWGRKFSYSVWTPLTATDAFVSYGIAPSCGAITVENAGHGYRTTSGAYTLISYGPNGHGGYLESGSRYFMGSDNADEWTNCHCNATGNVAGTSTNAPATYVEQDVTQSNASDPLSVFDDIVRYKNRWQMQNAYDGYVPNGIPCWPGFRADGVSSGDETGYSVAVGDVNGDGIPDLIIGAPGTSAGGSVYVVFGTRSGFPDPLPLSSLNGTNGFVLTSAAAGNQVGFAVAAGDVNGDGDADMIISAPYASPGGLDEAGSVYVVFGGQTGPNNSTSTPWTSCTSASPCTLQSGAGSFLNGVNGFELDGAVAGWFLGIGTAVAAGDVNGDGKADIIIGNYTAGSNSAGRVYVVFGGQTGADNNIGTAWTSCPCPLQSGTGNFINGANGVEFDAATPNNHQNVGASVAAGDINGDGVEDILIGAPGANVGSTYAAGSVYVVFGGSGPKSGGSWSATPYTLSSGSTNFLNGVNGVEFDGTSNYGAVGNAVAAGDFNGDGTPDLIIGAGAWNDNAAYVVFGGSGPKSGGSWSSTPYTLSSGSTNFLNGVNGAEFDGPASNYNGASIAAGDINDDGVADLIIGSIGASTPDYTYVYFGHKNTLSDPWPVSAYNLGGL